MGGELLAAECTFTIAQNVAVPSMCGTWMKDPRPRLMLLYLLTVSVNTDLVYGAGDETLNVLFVPKDVWERVTEGRGRLDGREADLSWVEQMQTAMMMETFRRLLPAKESSILHEEFSGLD